MWVRAACRESVANWMRLNESVQRGAAFHFHSEWICTQPEAVQQEMRRGERDKRLAMCVCVWWGRGWTVQGPLSFCVQVWNICILSLCMDAYVSAWHSIFHPWPPWSRSLRQRSSSLTQTASSQSLMRKQQNKTKSVSSTALLQPDITQSSSF